MRGAAVVEAINEDGRVVVMDGDGSLGC